MKQLDYCDRGLSSVSVDVLVAIGGGTIHDLTRYAATEYDIPFVSIPTAASVDGYAANVAALTWDGLKRTVAGVSPRWILADTDIFSAAPSRLTASGVSDFLGKYISILDWKIAHLVTGEYICEEVCDLLEKALRDAAIWDEVKDRLKKNALGMSGGQQQRLCIARALAVQPEVLLMDEPTSALDPISTSRIEELALKLKEDYTIIMVTHNMQQATRISDNTAFFLLGEVVEYDNTEQLFSIPRDKRTEDYITGRFG